LDPMTTEALPAILLSACRTPTIWAGEGAVVRGGMDSHNPCKYVVACSGISVTRER
jgi:enoyl-CoA hydratase/carnithine racemase